MPNLYMPDSRLRSAVLFLDGAKTVADIGTDHAYLPIYLIRNGYVESAVAADINRGPILSAQKNIAAAGLSHAIATVQTDGLHGIEKYRPDSVLIFGMGGELICKILSEAPWVKNERIGLILQPMSRAHVLRRFLSENGFWITGECIRCEEKKYYQTIAARYRGRGEHYTEEELLLGKRNIAENGPLFADFVRHEIKVIEAILQGKAKSERSDTSDEERILEFLKERLEKSK